MLALLHSDASLHRSSIDAVPKHYMLESETLTDLLLEGISLLLLFLALLLFESLLFLVLLYNETLFITKFNVLLRQGLFLAAHLHDLVLLLNQRFEELLMLL